MFTADAARRGETHEPDLLDQRIAKAVREAQRYDYTCADIRVYCDDPWRWTIKEELERRGFHSIDVPEITICGDVSFSW
jgi:hypothetical protein